MIQKAPCGAFCIIFDMFQVNICPQNMFFLQFCFKKVVAVFSNYTDIFCAQWNGIIQFSYFFEHFRGLNILIILIWVIYIFYDVLKAISSHCFCLNQLYFQKYVSRRLLFLESRQITLSSAPPKRVQQTIENTACRVTSLVLLYAMAKYSSAHINILD